ncbi:MAG: histidine phosphatase family protein [Deltaproteobacteria bacterium]|nr:histidine phosphatase family protein [Deltaproteobacteria bacterium]
MGALYLIRHGQASYGEADYDRLSTRGVEQAHALGRQLATLKLDAVYAGPLRRQVQTIEYATVAAEAIGIALPPATLVPELAEYPAFEMLQHLVPRLVEDDPKFADLVNNPTPRLLDDAFKAVLGRWARDEWAVPGVERVTDFVTRVQTGLERAIRNTTSGARIAAVTSAGPIGVALGLVFQLAAERMVRTSVVVRNASISELKFRTADFAWDPDKISLVTFNNTGHLPPELVSER